MIIQRRGKPAVVREFRVGDLDKSKCSYSFLQYKFPDDMIVYVRCHEDGTLDLRGNKKEYRIIKMDKNL